MVSPSRPKMSCSVLLDANQYRAKWLAVDLAARFETTARSLPPTTGQRIRMLSAMQFATSDGFNSIPSATGGIARLACARLDQMGKDPIVILSKVGLTPEEARDASMRMEVQAQIKLLELAAEEMQ